MPRLDERDTLAAEAKTCSCDLTQGEPGSGAQDVWSSGYGGFSLGGVTREEVTGADAWPGTKSGGYFSSVPRIWSLAGNTILAAYDLSGRVHFFTASGYQAWNTTDGYTLGYDGTYYVLTDAGGNRVRYKNFTVTSSDQGKWYDYRDASGNLWTVTLTSGEVSRVDGPNSGDYFELADGGVGGVTLKRSTTVLSDVDYEYDGTTGLLKYAVEKLGTTEIGRQYFRYYTSGGTGGYSGGLKYVFGNESYQRLKAYATSISQTPESLSDSQVAPYADKTFTYEDLSSGIRHRVESVQYGGTPVEEETHTVSTFPAGRNSWMYKTVKTLADGNTQTTYQNNHGQTMLDVFTETSTGKKWRTFYKYDSAGNLILKAHPSAVSGHDDQYADLLHETSGSYEYLRSSQGKVEVYGYYAVTTAQASTAGGVANYPWFTLEQRGQSASGETTQSVGTGNLTRVDSTAYVSLSGHGYSNGDLILVTGAAQPEYNGLFAIQYVNANQFTYTVPGTPATTATGSVKVRKARYVMSQTQYIARSGGGVTIYPVDNSKSYADEYGGSPRITRYQYGWVESPSPTTQMLWQKTMKPPVLGSENGPASNSSDTANADTEYQYFDTYGRVLFRKDAAGIVYYSKYDDAKGALVKSIADVNYADLTLGEKAEFDATGWSQPSGGLHLVTTMVVDDFGRTTKVTDPSGAVTYTYYNETDTLSETRVYRGWTGTNATLPIEVTRQHKDRGFSETLTMVTTPTVNSGAPTGQELLTTASLQTLSRTYTNRAGQSTGTLTYFNVIGLTYSTGHMGMEGVNYYGGGETTQPVLKQVVAKNASGVQQIEKFTPLATKDGETYYLFASSANGQTLATLSYTATSTSTISDAITSLATQWNSSSNPLHTPVTASVSGNTLTLTAETAGTAFYATMSGALTAQDSMGRVVRQVSPTGTITRSVFDAFGRVVSTWVGTNDVGATDSDPDGSGSPNNMRPVSQNEYDGGSALGDGHLTKTTVRPDRDTSSLNRVTEHFYDWRGRLIATKSGVGGSESTSDTVQRGLTYQVLNNLGQVKEAYAYDGDGVTITRIQEELTSGGDTDGVPNQPSDDYMRSKSVTDYDSQGRVFRTRVYSVTYDQSTQLRTGISSVTLDSLAWFDHRGNVIKTMAPGGQVTKTEYDRLGRAIKLSITNGGGDTGWSDADDVTGDVVLSQQESVYDLAGNVVASVSRERYHNETDTGALQGPTGTRQATATSPRASAA